MLISKMRLEKRVTVVLALVWMFDVVLCAKKSNVRKSGERFYFILPLKRVLTDKCQLKCVWFTEVFLCHVDGEMDR